MESNTIFSVTTYNDMLNPKDDNYEKSNKFVSQLFNKEYEYSGWVHQPWNISIDTINSINVLADKVRNECDVLIIIGIGGSFLGAKAVIDALNPCTSNPRIYFVGHTLSSCELQNAVDLIQKYETDVCIVSKSGNTFETLLTWSVIKKALKEKYGPRFAQKVITITDSQDGTLRFETKTQGYRSLPIENDIGGRYSAFTASTLLPIAVAGLNIKEFIDGARVLANRDIWTSEKLDYCVARVLSQNKGKAAEMIAVFEPRLKSFVEWIRQLFAESEGKDGKGLFPINLLYTQDLHSIGQYIQQGHQFFCETLIYVKKNKSILIPQDYDLAVAGKCLDDINEIACEAVIKAHLQNDIGIVRIDLEQIDEYNLGQIMYFYMMTAAVSGLCIGINPFNQPGVETYKKKISELIQQN